METVLASASLAILLEVGMSPLVSGEATVWYQPGGLGITPWIAAWHVWSEHSAGEHSSGCPLIEHFPRICLTPYSCHALWRDVRGYLLQLSSYFLISIRKETILKPARTSQGRIPLAVLSGSPALGPSAPFLKSPPLL